MAKAFDFKITGLDKFQRQLKKAPAELNKKLDKEIKATVADINAAQVSKAPIDDGYLRGQTGFLQVPSAKIEYMLYSNAPYAAYIEFGTGGLVDVPKGLESYAIQFKGKGIKQVNLPARAYFFTPFLTEKDALVKRLATIIKNFYK